MRLGLVAVCALAVWCAEGVAATPANIADAIRKGDLPAVEAFLAGSGADLNAHTDGGRTLLSLAVESHQEAIVEWLVGRGADVNAVDLPPPGDTYDGITPLGQAARGDFVETAQFLIARGARVDGNPGDAFSPLVFAATQGSPKVAELLIAKGARVDLQCPDGGTALQAATEFGQRALIGLLIAHGANPSLRESDGSTALTIAINTGNVDLVTLLVAQGADVNEPESGRWLHRRPLEMAVSRARSSDYPDLHLAIRLLELGADPRLSADAGNGLVREAMKQGPSDLVNALVFYGADARGTGVVARLPALVESPCSIGGVRFEEEAPTIAEVIGERGRRLPMHPDYPDFCGPAIQRCLGTAFLVAGDRVNVGPQCGKWSDVEFKAGKVTSWGWVETAGLRTLGASLGGEFTLHHQQPPPTTPPAICSIEQARLDEGLKAAQPPDPFPAPKLDFQTPARLPAPLASTDASAADDAPGMTIADARIDGMPVKIVDVTSADSCAGVDGIQIWTRDFRRKLVDSGVENDGGDSPGQLVDFQRRTYLDREIKGGRNLFGFDRNLEPDLQCRLAIAPRRPQIATVAQDPGLCDAVAAGKVEDIAMDGSRSAELTSEAVRDDDEETGNARYTLDARAAADLYGDGHPVGFGVVTRYVSGTGRCPVDDSTELPVVLDQHGAPDLSVPKLAMEADAFKLIRYRGAVYLDARTLDPASPPANQDGSPTGEEIDRSHQVWKLSRTGSTLMCSFSTEHYEIQH